MLKMELGKKSQVRVTKQQRPSSKEVVDDVDQMYFSYYRYCTVGLGHSEPPSLVIKVGIEVA